LKLPQPACAGRGHLVEFGDVAGADGHVQAVVDDHLVAGARLPGGQRVEHGLVGCGLDEVDDGRGAARGRGAGAVVEVVGRGEAADGHLQVDVDVDAAGDDQLARGVDLPPPAQVAADGGDGLAGDGDVGREDFVGGDDGAVFDDEVIGGWDGFGLVGHGIRSLPVGGQGRAIVAHAGLFANGIISIISVAQAAISVAQVLYL